MNHSSGVGRELADPLKCHFPLPHSATFYPLGFSVQVESNSKDILAAAEESWGAWRRQYDAEPVRLKIAVAPEGDLAIAPEYRAQEHLLTIVSDQNNYAVVDLDRLFGSAVLSQTTAGDHAWLRWYFLEAMAYCSLSQRYVAPIHAASVSRKGMGVLIFGPSGAGKSTLAYACARAGWVFTSDDASNLLQDSSGLTIIGKPHQARFRDDAPELFPELSGYSVRARPHGKLSLEVPLDELEGIRTSPTCELGCIVTLNRGYAPRLERISGEELIEEFLSHACFYGNRTFERHRRTLQRALEKPVYRMDYRTLDEAIEMLERITE